jgi:hypothetical protein
MRQHVLIVAAAALAVLLLAALLASAFVTPRTQGAIVSWLVDRFGGRATIEEVQWSLRPGLRITASGVEVTGPDPHAAAPLIEIERVTLETNFGDLFAAPRRIGLVRLRGLLVRIPPRKKPARTVRPPAPGASPDHEADAERRASGIAAVRIDRIVAETTRIEIVSSRPDKPPLVFDVHDLSLENLAADRPMNFMAQLTNPKPIGEVATEGTFGPWNKEDPGSTFVEGRFRFADADLGSLRGLTGTLQAEGTYSGSIAEIHASGSADIAQFAVTGRPVDLATRFDVVVGGTSGDVVLQPVDVTVLESHISSAGAIVRSRELKGRRIEMDVRAPKARVEDLLRLALKSDPPPLSGPIELETALRIEPGDAPVIRRLHLNGRFTIRQARFARTDIQKTLARVSSITAGQSVGGEEGSSVAANLMGRFTLEDGTLRFARVSFEVPGTAVRLAGSYGIESGILDLGGTVRIARSIADLAPVGVAGWLETLGRLDKRLKVDATGTTIPITIKGPRDKPVFRVDVDALKGDWRGAIGLGR